MQFVTYLSNFPQIQIHCLHFHSFCSDTHLHKCKELILQEKCMCCMTTRLAYNVTNIYIASADIATSRFHHEMVMIKTFVSKLSTSVSGSSDHHKSETQNLGYTKHQKTIQLSGYFNKNS
jgi:hypothetical protein